MLTQSEVSEDLGYCGLGEMTQPTDSPREFEAYGDGKLNVVRVLKDGTTVFLDGYGKELHRSKMEDSEQIIELTTKFGHYASC